MQQMSSVLNKKKAKILKPKTMHDDRTSVAIQEYLAAIFEMSSEGVPTIGVRLAEWLRVTPPTVIGTLRRMERDGLVVQTDSKEVTLTGEGQRLAEAIVRRHRLAERFLVDVLQFDWHRAHQEAGRWEHAISEEVEERLAAFMDNPVTCPHGNPIPGSGYVTPRDTFSLREARDGQDVVVERVFEEIEQSSEIMEFLNNSGIRRGTRLSVAKVSPALGTVAVQVNGATMSVGLHVAEKILVRPAS